MTSRQKLAAWLGTAGLASACAFVGLYEGTVLKSYPDIIGVWTACTGETAYIVKPGDIKPGAKFTPEQCTERLALSLASHAEPVIRCTAPAVLTPGQKIAFLSFAYNVGGANFCASTLAKKARAGDLPGACRELSRWTMAGGKEVRGLVNRRAAERKLCEAK